MLLAVLVLVVSVPVARVGYQLIVDVLWWNHDRDYKARHVKAPMETRHEHNSGEYDTDRHKDWNPI